MSRHRTKPNELSPQEVQFCYEYINNGRNGTHAYMAAYPNIKYEGARVAASRLLSRPNITTFLDEKHQELLKKLNITPERTMTEMASLGYLKIHKNPEKLSKADIKTLAAIGHVKIGALDKLAKTQKLYEPDVVVPVSGDLYTGPVIMRLPQKQKIDD